MAFVSNPIRSGTLFTSAARTEDANSATITNMGSRGAIVKVNISAISGTNATGTFTVQGYDELSGSWYTILASAAKTATGFFTLTVYPGNTVTSNVSASTVLPKQWRLNFDISATTTPSVTFSATYDLIP